MIRILSVVSLAALIVSGCTCNPTNCTAGAAMCACKPDNVCDTGLVCGADMKCGAGSVAGFAVSDPAARGCELVLTEAGTTAISKVTFKEGVVGTFIREAPRTAVSFVADKDATIPTGAVEVALSGDGSGVTVSSVSCVNAAGEKLAGATVSIR